MNSQPEIKNGIKPFIDSVGEDKFLDLIDKIQIKKYLLDYLRGDHG